MAGCVRVVAVTGAPGVGKTEVGRRLVARVGRPAAVIDTDTMSDVRPWAPTDDIFALVAANTGACLENYLAWGAEVVVISGVLLVDGILAHFADLLADPRLDWQFYGLRATPDRIAERIAGDHKFQDAAGRMGWRHIDAHIAAVPGIRMVDTSELGIDEVVEHIAAREFPGTAGSARPVGVAGAPRRTVEVTREEALARAASALRSAGLPTELADEVADDLVLAEVAGCPSHGLQRVPEYVAAVAAGAAVPDAQPEVRHLAAGSAVIDANRAFGVRARACAADTLCALAARNGVAVVALRRSGHLGRLRPLAERVGAAGNVLLGFVNCGGAGQKVSPPGGTEGRLATNPLVLAVPALPGPPLIVDTTTSATSEGAVRVAAALGRSLPAGLLIGRDGRPAGDPALLYEDPPRVTIEPLGGIAAHRGHALAAGVEVLAGIVAGAGFSSPDPPPFSNGALFVAFRAGLLGRDPGQIGAEVAELERHLAACPVRPGADPPRLPGRAAARIAPDRLEVPVALWQELGEMCGEPT